VFVASKNHMIVPVHDNDFTHSLRRHEIEMNGYLQAPAALTNHPFI
jgi:hypothetical protein